MHHQGRVHVIERTGNGQSHLSAATFLGRSPQDEHPPARLVGHRCCRDRGANARGPDHVVATGVTDSGKGVVFAKNGHGRSGRTSAPRKRSRDPTSSPFHFQTRAFENVGEQIVGSVLGEGKLWMGVERPRYRHQLL